MIHNISYTPSGIKSKNSSIGPLEDSYGFCFPGAKFARHQDS